MIFGESVAYMWCLCKLKEDFSIQRIVEVIDLYDCNIDYVGFSFFRSFAIKIDLSFHFQVAYIHNFNLLNSFKIFKSFELFIVHYL